MAEHSMPLPLGSLEREAAIEVLEAAEEQIRQLKDLFLPAGMTDAAFASCVARIVVPLERIAKELCR